MTRMLSLLVLVLAALSACGQTVANIDTRAKSGSGPLGHLLGSSSKLSEDTATLEAEFVINDVNGLTAGNPFEYELLITNRGKDPVAIPQALNWGDVQVGESEPYSWALVDIRVDVGHGLEANLPNSLKLYGSRDKQWSEIELGPGDSVRILGSMTLPVSMNINTKEVGKAALKGLFHLGTMRVYRTPTAAQTDAYRTESHWLFSAVAHQSYPANLEMEP